MTDRVDLTPEDPRTPEELDVRGYQPGIDPEGYRVVPGSEPAVEPEPVTEEEVATWLERLGRIFNALWRAVGGWLYPNAVVDALGRLSWLFTPEELEEIPPPLTRVINRRFGRLRGVIRNADELELVFRLEEYVRVNITVIRAAEAGPEAPPAEEIEELPEGHPDRGPGGFGLEP